MIRLGGPIGLITDPEAAMARAQELGYTAVSCELPPEADARFCARLERAARDADVAIAELGAWSNPLSHDPAEAAAAHRRCISQLAAADRVGAACCVNISGSCGRVWDGPHEDNLTEATFARVVESVRAIIDAVRPDRARYCLETMPWMHPDSPEEYLRLIDAVDRGAFAAHLDPVNLCASPRALFGNAELIRRCVRLLADHLVSCHAKDVVIAGRLTVHIDEAPAGTGRLDYPAYLRALDAIGREVPLVLEHLPDDRAYAAAADRLRAIARASGVALHPGGAMRAAPPSANARSAS